MIGELIPHQKVQVIVKYKVGEIVRWCWTEIHQSTYTILDINERGVILKQNFSIGSTLNGRIPITELDKN